MKKSFNQTMSQEKLHEFYSFLLVGTGTAGTTISFWSNLDLAMSIVLKFVSLGSFIIFILINQDNIKEGWTKLKNRFK